MRYMGILFGVSGMANFENYTHTHIHYSRPLWFLHTNCGRAKVSKMKITLCLYRPDWTCYALTGYTYTMQTQPDTFKITGPINNVQNDNKWTENLECCVKLIQILWRIFCSVLLRRYELGISIGFDLAQAMLLLFGLTLLFLCAAMIAFDRFSLTRAQLPCSYAGSL